MKDTHYYEVNLVWNHNSKGTLSSPILPNKIEVATPPEFPNGIKEIWTPEHLFVAAVNSCLMSTFLLVAANSKFEFISFEFDSVDNGFVLFSFAARWLNATSKNTR